MPQNEHKNLTTASQQTMYGNMKKKRKQKLKHTHTYGCRISKIDNQVKIESAAQWACKAQYDVLNEKLQEQQRE